MHALRPEVVTVSTAVAAEGVQPPAVDDAAFDVSPVRDAANV